VELSWLLFGTILGLDETGRVFLLLTAILWLAAGVYARGYLAADRQQRRFWFVFLLTMSGNLGLPLAFDMISFYCFFALMSFAAYGLVIHERTAFARRAGAIYLGLVMVGEILLFAALLLLAPDATSLLLADAASALVTTERQSLILALLITAFGIKIGMLPLHIWLPLAHPAAPLPASAVLSGAMIKAGALGLLRLLPASGRWRCPAGRAPCW
jgi:formate hydrogenlyase subunit 3/multisubunit Na+/H+ antiporter MnhD subunit